MARPKKESEPRNVRIVVYLTQSDADKLKAESDKTGKPVSDILRDLVKEHIR